MRSYRHDSEFSKKWECATVISRHGLVGYGFLILVLEHMTADPGNRIALTRDAIQQIIGPDIEPWLDVDSAIELLDRFVEDRVLESDGLGVWFDGLDKLVSDTERRKASASQAAKARWEREKKLSSKNSRAVMRELAERKLETTPDPLPEPDFLDSEPDPLPPPPKPVEEQKKKLVKDELLPKIGADEIEFESEYNRVRAEALGRPSKVSLSTNGKARRRLKDILKKKNGPGIEGVKTVIKNAFADEYHKGNNFKFVTMDFLLRDEIFNRWLDYDHVINPVSKSEKPKLGITLE